MDDGMSDIPELLERYRRGPEVIATLMTGAAGPELDFRPGADRWTLRQIVAHLADSEIVSAARFRRIIAEDNPTLIGYDQNAWAANLNYAKRKTSESVDMFRRLRADCYELLKDLPPETFARKGNHSEIGPMTLRQLLQIMAEHAEGHARQIQQVREAYRNARRAGA
jgi:DinB superfamily